MQRVKIPEATSPGSEPGVPTVPGERPRPGADPDSSNRAGPGRELGSQSILEPTPHPMTGTI